MIYYACIRETTICRLQSGMNIENMKLVNSLRNRIKSIVPQKVWNYGTYLFLRIFRKEESYLFKIKSDLFSDSYTNRSKFEKEISYMKSKQKLYSFPYSFIEKYDQKMIQVHCDNNVQMFYVIHMI